MPSTVINSDAEEPPHAVEAPGDEPVDPVEPVEPVEPHAEPAADVVPADPPAAEGQN